MFNFLRDKLYRKKYISYAFYIVLLSVLILFTFVFVMIYVSEKELREEAVELYENIESNIDSSVDKIERYMAMLYKDNALLTDMMYFLGNDIEEYMTLRLSNSTYTSGLSSIVKSLNNFVSDETSCSQISIHDFKYGNAILFNSGQVDIITMIRNSDDIFKANINKGILYERKLTMPNTISKNAGSIQFVFDSSFVFAVAKNSALPNLTAVDNYGNCYFIKNKNNYSNDTYRDIVELDNLHGVLYQGFSRINYLVLNSNGYGYKLVLTYNNRYLAEQRLISILSLMIIISIVDLLILFFIARYMNKEWDFLGSIIRTINLAKTGEFKIINKNYRSKAYKLIADELNDMCGKLQHHIETEYLLKLKQQKTEMISWQHQIEPHFLYNTLEIIRSFAMINNDTEVADALANLGKMYRGITKSDMVITIEEEIGLLKSYLDVMSFKFKDSFSYQIQVEASMLKINTIKFWMQPIAENYFKHGYQDESEFNLLALSGYDGGNSWIFEIINNGLPIKESKLFQINESFNLISMGDSDKIGLTNVYERLRYFYGERFNMSIKNNADSGITVRICINKDVTENV